MKKLKILALLTPALLIFAAVASAYVFLNSDWGLNLTMRAAKSAFPGEMVYESATGKLSDTITLKNVELTHKDFSSKINSLRIKWQPISLLKRTFDVQELTLDTLTIIPQENFKIQSSSSTKKPISLPLKLDIKKIAIQKVNVQTKDGTAEVSGKITDEWDLHWNLKYTSFNSTGKITGPILQPTLSGELNTVSFDPELKTHSKFDINAAINKPFGKKRSLTLNITLHPGTITYPIDLQNKTFSYAGGNISTTISASTISGNLDLKFIEKSQLKGQWEIPKPFKKIDASVSWLFPSITFAQPLIPNITDLDGALHLNYDISGNLLKPNLKGHAILADAHFSIPKLNAHFSDIQGDAIANGKQIDYTLSANAAEGNLLLQGRTDIEKSLASTFTLTGEKALISNTKNLKLYASPNLSLQVVDKDLILHGKLHLPKGHIGLEGYSETASLPDDVVIINQDSEDEEPKWQLMSEIELTLGDDIDLMGMGLKGKIGGQLKISDSPEKTTVAHGLLRVTDGTYKFYSTDLKIEKGHLIFTGGPITNPGLNVQAARHFSSTQSSRASAPALTVGLNINGTLNKPIITLYSSPKKYEESDILSFLLLGQPLEQAGTDNANILLSAASALDIGGDGKISNVRNQIKNTLGLAELDITSETEYVKKTNKTIQHTALVLGKYLSPKLYVKYSFDVLDHSNRVQLRYWLNNNWSVQTESRGPASSGVDVLYSIERK